MAARVNTKFIIILLATVSIAGGIIGGLLYLQYRGDASRQIVQGDELFEQGDAQGAARHYGRAVRLDPTNRQYIHKLIGAMRQMRPETNDAARESYSRLLTAMRQEVQYHGGSPEPHLKLLSELFDNARIMSILAPRAAARQQWEQLASAADDMILRVPSTDPEQIHGYLYRGIANVQLHASLTDEQLTQAEQDLVRFVEQMPNDDLGWAALSESRQIIAEHYHTTGNTRRHAEAIDKIPGTIEQAIEAVPNGPEVARVYAQYLAMQRRANPTAVAAHDVQMAVDRAMELSRQSNDKWLVLMVSRMLQTVGGVENIDAAIALYNDYLQRDPEGHTYRYLLGQLQFRAGHLDEAASTAEIVMDAQPLPVSFVSQMQLMLRRLAASLLVDIEYQRAVTAGDAMDLTALTSARDRLAGFAVDPENDAQLLRANAKIAVLEEDYQAAASGFERLVREGTADAEALMLSAWSLQQLGQIGLAHERTVAAIEQLAAPNPALLYRKAQQELQMGRFDDARNSIAMFLNLEPDSRDGLALSRIIEARIAGEEVASDDPVVMALNDAQRFLQAGQTDNAAATISAALVESPDDLRLLDAAARVAVSAGRTEAAMDYVDRALARWPDAARTRQLKVMLEVGDPVEAVIQYVEAEHADDEDQAVVLLTTLVGLAEHHRRMAAQSESSGRAEEAAESRDIAARAEARVAVQLERALASTPDHPRLIEYQFAKALEDRDWNKAESMANRARELNTDQCRGFLFRGRYEQHRGRFDEAVRAFQQATELIPFSSFAWRGLANSYQRLGNVREATRAFEQAYRANPNDLQTIRAYIGLLVQSGERTRAARIAETAHRVMPNDEALRETWLQLESEMGNVATVLPVRREIFGENPGNRANASRLALLLGRTEPTVNMVLDDEGNRVYSDRRWAQMNVQEQRRVLMDVRNQWRREADDIVHTIAAEHGTDIGLTSLKALLARERGDIPGGERIMREFIDGHDASDVTAEMLIALGQYQVESGQFQGAYETYLRAIERQQEGTAEADLAMGNFLFDRGSFSRAIEHLEKALQVQPDQNVAFRVVEAYLNQGRFEEAERRLQQAMANNPASYVGSVLQALVAHGQATELAQQGRTVEADAKFEEHKLALDTAIQLMPTNPAPYVVRARSIVRDYQRTGQRAILNDAMRELARADEVRPDDVQTRLARVEVLQAMGNANGAVAEVNRLVQQDPSSISHRRLLVQLHMQAGNHTAAIAAINQAIEQYPTMVMWHEMLGNVYVAAGDMPQATASFRRAFDINQSVPTLARYVGTLMAHETPDYAAVIAMLRSVPEQVNQEPILAASLSHALFKSNRAEPAMQYLRQSYQAQRELIARGERPAVEIGRWYEVLAPVFAAMSPTEAESLILELCRQDPGPFDLLWMGRQWRSRGPEGYSRATELLSQAVDKAGPGQSELRMMLQFELANYYLEATNYESAARAYNRVLQINPDHAPSLNNLAFLMAQYLDDPRGALAHAQRAVELLPDEASVLDTAGWVQFKLGNYMQAEDLLHKSLRVNETANTQFHLANVFFARGEYDEAVSRLRRAGELRPDPQLKAEIDRLADDIRTKRAEAR